MLLGIHPIARLILDHVVVDSQQFVEHGVDIRFAIDYKVNKTIAAACEEVVVVADQVAKLDAGED